MAERRQHPRAPGTTHSVRRNLFNSQLSRRPPTTATSSSSTGAGSVAHFDSVLDAATDDSSSDILVRNANGEYAVTIPGVPPPAADAAAVTGAGAGGEEEAADLEVESRLAELLNNRTRQSTEQELVDAVRASLQRRVDALAEDQWIFEGENSKT